MTERSGHVNTFARDSLPPQSLWPEMRYDRIPELTYPGRLNCAGELLDRMVERGNGTRPVFHHASGVWSYADLLAPWPRLHADECAWLAGFARRTDCCAGEVEDEDLCRLYGAFRVASLLLLRFQAGRAVSVSWRCSVFTAVVSLSVAL